MIGRFFLAIFICAIVLFIFAYGGYRLFYYEPYMPISTSQSSSWGDYYPTSTYLENLHWELEMSWAFLIFIVCWVTAMFIVMIADHFIHIVNPLVERQGTLVRKKARLQAAHGRGFGTFAVYEFWFLDENGEEICYTGGEMPYTFLMEGNKVAYTTKALRIVDFELLSVD